MASLPTRGGPHFGAPVHVRLTHVGDKRLAAVSLQLSKIFSGRMALSTLFEGPRPDPMRPEAAADLADLENVLPLGTLSRDAILRDRFGAEPRMLAWLRQIEGRPPQALAVLCPMDERGADDAVNEARAVGYSLAPGERCLALKAPGGAHILDKQLGKVVFGAGSDWDSLDQAAVTAGLNALAGLAAIFESPLEAAELGVFSQVRIGRRFGHAWQVHATLPPLSRTTEALTWVFRQQEAADRALVSIARDLDPLIVESFPATDALIAAAAELAPAHKGFEDPEAVGVRLVSLGSADQNRATVRAAQKIARMHGGKPVWPQGGPAWGNVEAVMAACGATRLERPLHLGLPVPEGSHVMAAARAVRGRLSRFEVVTYIRDLADSVGEAQRTLGLPEDPPPQSPNIADAAGPQTRALG